MSNPYLHILKQSEASEDKKRIASLERQLAESRIVLQAAMNFIHEQGLDNKFFDEEIKPLQNGVSLQDGDDRLMMWHKKRYESA